MRKFNLKSFIMGAIVSCIVMVQLNPVLASSLTKSIDVIYNDIKIYIDDKKINPTDPNGNVVEPFIYNGTTYLPVRVVADAFGKPVTWDGKTSSIYLGKHESATPSTMIQNLDYFTDNGNYWIWTSPKDNTGKTYTQGLVAHYRTAEREWLLNGQYSKMTGTFIMNYDKRSTDYEGKLVVYGDDNVIYSSEELKKGELPIDFSIDLTGILKLKIVLETDTNSATYKDVFGIVDVGLYQ